MMKTITVREAGKGLSHPETLFVDANEVVVTKHGQPILRRLPAAGTRKVHSMAGFRAKQRMQSVANETMLAQDRQERL